MKFLRAMKKLKIKKQIIAAVMACVLGIGGIYSVHASVINDAKNKKNEAQQELDNLNSQIDEIQAAQSDLQEEMDAYDDQLMALLTDMDLLEHDMDAKQDEIDQANADLEVAQEKEQTQYNAMKTRIQYMYENGDSNYWEAMMGATSITDLLNRVEYVSEVYDYDRKQLTAYQETVQQVADLKDQLNAQLAEMEELKISYEDQASSLQALIAEKSAAMDNFDAQLASAKSLASQYADTIKQQNQIIANEQARQAAEEAAARRAAQQQQQQNAGNQSNTTGSDTNASASGSGTGLTSSGLNPAHTTNVSGSDVVAFASQYVGYPYVYGGNSLTNGVDCSGFTQQVYLHFGYSIPRRASIQATVGTSVAISDLQPGDLVFYGDSEGVGHVVIYIGNGKVVHASTPSKGIIISDLYYRTPMCAKRII